MISNVVNVSFQCVWFSMWVFRIQQSSIPTHKDFCGSHKDPHVGHMTSPTSIQEPVGCFTNTNSKGLSHRPLSHIICPLTEWSVRGRMVRHCQWNAPPPPSLDKARSTYSTMENLVPALTELAIIHNPNIMNTYILCGFL